MDECMPHYYKITDGHGQGAERIMRAEAAFLQGRFVDAQIELERAYAQISGNGQENMALCCDFLAWRLSLCTGDAPRCTMARRRQELLRQHNVSWLNILDATAAYYGALTGGTEEIPPVFREHRLSSLSLLAPGRPMLEMIENQVWLAQGAYAKVIGRSAALLETCAGLHYALVALHVRIQTAAAYARLGKVREARELLALCLSACGSGAPADDGGDVPDDGGGSNSSFSGGSILSDEDFEADVSTWPDPAAAARGAGGLCRADRPGAGGGAAGGGAYEQPGDRGEAVPLGGQRQAVRQPHLCQAVYRGRHPHQAEASGGYGASLTKG